MYEFWPTPVLSGDASGVCGRLKTYASGELGALLNVGVSGLRADARDEGREIGLRLLESNKNGTPAMSSRCLCMSSSMYCSS